MPFDVTQIGKQSSVSNQKASYFDIFSDITYLSRKMNISPDEVWQLPHSHYLAYLKFNVTYDLQQTEEGREILDKFERYMNPRTEPDLNAIRNFTGYKKATNESG